ncbi:permease-like cell division protein FtsX [Peptococcaceae bacterium]|nr:permease-like cell division protein FtsX [Peptococcaceae bacterium]
MTVLFNTLRYAVREAFISLVRNGWLSFAVVFVITISLVIVGGSVLVMLNADHLAERLESEMEIRIFLEEDLKQEDIENIGEQIRSTAGVASVEYIPKEKGLQQLKESFEKSYGEAASILDNLPKNPLPDVYRVEVENPKEIAHIAHYFAEIDGVETVRYGENWVEKLLFATNWMRLATVMLLCVLGVAAVFLIATAIKMSVLARKDEIAIMKLLGASSWYVWLPFLLEGLLTIARAIAARCCSPPDN